MLAKLCRWPVAVLTALDRLAHAILFGDDRNTISGAAYWAEVDGKWWAWARPAIDWLFRVLFRQEDHCFRSALFDAAAREVEEDICHP